MVQFNTVGAVFLSLLGTLEHNGLPQMSVLTPSPSTN